MAWKLPHVAGLNNQTRQVFEQLGKYVSTEANKSLAALHLLSASFPYTGNRCYQFGSVVVPTNAITQAVTFPVAFPNTISFVMLTITDPNSGTWAPVARSQTTTGFTASTGAAIAAPITMSWFAVGS